METQERIAIHEAGHAVAYSLCGITLQEVSIEPDASGGGHTTPAVSMRQLAQTRDLGAIRDWLFVLYAGLAAEEIYRGGEFAPEERLQGQYCADYGLIKEAVQWLPDNIRSNSNLAGFLGEQLNRAREELAHQRRRTAIDAIVTELNAHKTIAGPLADRIIKKALASGVGDVQVNS